MYHCLEIMDINVISLIYVFDINIKIAMAKIKITDFLKMI